MAEQKSSLLGAIGMTVFQAGCCDLSFSSTPVSGALPCQKVESVLQEQAQEGTGVSHDETNPLFLTVPSIHCSCH